MVIESAYSYLFMVQLLSVVKWLATNKIDYRLW